MKRMLLILMFLSAEFFILSLVHYKRNTSDILWREEETYDAESA